MKIYEIEAGQKINIPTDDIKELSEKIKIECSDAVQAISQENKFLYRGMKLGNSVARFFKLKPSLKIFLGMPREDRKPVDVSVETQGKYDSYLRKFGMTALRSNSIFCTSNKLFAERYGTTYLIFPKNGFDFTWSPDTSDLTDDIKVAWITKRFPVRFSERYENVTDISFNDWLRYYFSQHEFYNKDFVSALKSGNEILIRGEFYAVNDTYTKYFTT